MVSAYAWNDMPIDGTDIARSIPAICRPLLFPMNISLEDIYIPINDAGAACVRYIRSISKDAMFGR